MILKNFSTNQLSRLFFLTAFSIGIIHTWTGRYVICGDAIPYLDIGDAYFRGDLQTAINPFWSPLYSWILGFALFIFKPLPSFESTFIHLVNFVIYLAAFFCFDFFLQELIKYNKYKESDLLKNNLLPLPEWGWLAIGYSLFIWSSMNLITISSVTPDMSVSALVYLITGLLLKIKSRTANWLTPVCIGITLGLGYLTKAIMFPLAFVYISLIFFLRNDFRSAWRSALIIFVAFFFIASPFIFTISKLKGYFTYSESPKLNYAWDVDETTYECHKNISPVCGKLTHPTRKIFSNPNIYEYSTLIKATDPVWHDPSYWQDGFKVHFTLKGQLKALAKSILEYFELIFNMQSVLVTGFLILFFISAKNSLKKELIENNILLVPPICAMLIYSFAHIEYRYIGAFITVFYTGLFSLLKLPNVKETKQITSCIIIGLTVFLLFTGIVSKDLFENIRNNSAYLDWQVAKKLKELGFKEGDKTAVILVNNDFYWARLAKMQVISEVSFSELNDFWTVSDQTKREVFKAFKKAGANIVVAESIPEYNSQISWTKIKNTPYYFYLL